MCFWLSLELFGTYYIVYCNFVCGCVCVCVFLGGVCLSLHGPRPNSLCVCLCGSARWFLCCWGYGFFGRFFLVCHHCQINWWTDTTHKSTLSVQNTSLILLLCHLCEICWPMPYVNCEYLAGHFINTRKCANFFVTLLFSFIEVIYWGIVSVVCSLYVDYVCFNTIKWLSSFTSGLYSPHQFFWAVFCSRCAFSSQGLFSGGKNP